MSRGRGYVVVVVGLLVCLAAAAPASGFGVSSFSVTPADPRAGAHSDVAVDLALADPAKDLRDVTLHLPAGLLGNPRATPLCSDAQLQGDTCPAGTEVGSITVVAAALGLTIPATGTVYNVTPAGDDPARLGIVIRPVGGLLGKLVTSSRITIRTTSDYGLDARLADLPRTLNGIPIDVHSMSLVLNGRVAGGKGFMVNPTSCAPAHAGAEVDAYDAPAPVHADASFTPTDCAGVPFGPSLGVSVDDARTAVPSGYEVRVQLPEEVGGRAPATLRRAAVILPEGTALSAPSSDGLEACTDDQFGYGSAAAPACPAASQIGTVTLDTPLLGALPGQVFFATGAPGDPYRLFVAAQMGSVLVKLRASVRLDERTGQITTVLDDLPQVPLTTFSLRFRGGDHAILTTPRGCGTQTARAALTPWSGAADAQPTSDFSVSTDGSGGCAPIPFAPSVAATPSSTAARGDTALRLAIDRPDRADALSSIATVLPAGLLGRLDRIPRCPDEAAAQGACPTDSRVGTVTAKAGEGAAPIALGGSVSFAGPVGRSLASLVIAIPAKVGPIDLGTVTVRAPIRLRRGDGRVEVDADLPSVVGGIPLELRSMTLDLDRDGFLFNPSGCDGRAVELDATSLGGSTAQSTAPYAATGCDKLPFDPHITALVPLGAPNAPKDHVPLEVAIEQSPDGQALRDVAVTLPAQITPDVTAVARTCPAAALAKDACLPASIVGSATATTPLLPSPLNGPVRLAIDRPDAGADPSGGLDVPPLVADLSGDADLRVVGRQQLTPRGNLLRTAFSGLPDVPLQRFALAFVGGSGGALTAARNLCVDPPDPIGVEFTSQDGVQRTAAVPVAIPACKGQPRVTATLKRAGTTAPVLKLTVKQSAQNPPLRRLALGFPDEIDTSKARARRGVKVGSRAKAKLSAHGVVVTPRRATRRLSLQLSRGAIRLDPATRRRLSRNSQLTVRLAVQATPKSGKALPVLPLDVEAAPRRT